MTKDTVKNYTLYKMRFWIGYGSLTLLLAGVLVFAALYVPGGFTGAEQQSALRSASLNLNDLSSLLIVDLPYHALQKLSIALLGLSSFAVKLPSLVLGILTAVGVVLILSKRFSRTVSILTAGILMISAQFISLATTGTPQIMSVFWPVLLLLIASFGIRNKQIHPSAVYAGSIVAALSLFTPFSVYILLALALGGLLHPHIRYIFRRSSRHAIWIGSAILFAMLGLIGYISYKNYDFLAHLLYKTDDFSFSVLENLKLIAMQLVDFSSSSTAETGLLTPIFGLTVFVLAGIGVYSLLYWRHSVVSYMIFSWTLLLVPILLFNPTSLPLLIVPLIFLVAAGTNFLLRYWYKLFPRNPYARVFALAPVTILFACIIMSGSIRYFYAFHYYAPLANASSHDLELIQQEITKRPSATLLVSKDERPFYQLYLDSHDINSTRLVDSTYTLLYDGKLTDDVIATRASQIISTRFEVSQIVANSRAMDASDRLYIYKKDTK